MNALKNQKHTLCFKEDEFQDPKFSVDQFVSRCKDRVSMPSLREDLEIYYKSIQLSLIELINQDYADFVSLSSNLIGTDKSIENLSVPLNQMKEEIELLKDNLKSVLVKIDMKLKQRQNLRNRKARLHHLINVVHSVEKIEKILSADPKSPDMEIFLNEDKNHPGNFLERIAGEFNQLQFHVNQSKGHPVIETIRQRVSLITTKLQENLESTFDDGITKEDLDIVLRCLRTYALIDKTSYAEDLFRHLVVKPYVAEVVTETYLKEHSLDKLCDTLLTFVQHDCSIVLDLVDGQRKDHVNKESLVKGFDFLVNSIWVEISDAFQQNLPMLFSAGNPDVFLKRYKTMMNFLEKFENICGSRESYMKLINHQSYHSFTIKWSLPVYFQIRFQEIGSEVEIAVESPFSKHQGGKLFMTNIVGVIWSSIVKCWSEDIFIHQLSGRFWKLHLQLGSRLSVFVKSVVANNKVESQKYLESCKDDSANIENLTLLLGDTNYFLVKYKDYYRTTIQKSLLTRLKDIQLFQDSLNEICDNISNSLRQLEKQIIEIIASSAIQSLENIQALPRLYRRTNREPPSEPSSYVQTSFSSVDLFRTSATTLTDKKQKVIQREALEKVTNSFYTSVNDLLTSIRKTEDSLLRLKQQRKAAIGKTDSGISNQSTEVSDENKIRKQIALDVQLFCEQCKQRGIEQTKGNTLEELQKITEEYLSIGNI